MTLLCGLSSCAVAPGIVKTGECTADGLTRALSVAKAGTTVHVGACTVEGAFSVPAGVTLAGIAAGASTIRGPAGKPALSLIPGGSVATSVNNLVIVSNGTAGILAQGQGAIEIETVTVKAATGIGLGVQDATSLTVNGLELSGPETPSSASSTYPPDPHSTATHGVVLVDVKGTNNTLSNVTAKGFAEYGALLVRSEVNWANGGASSNFGTGLMIVGGNVSLDTVDLSGNYQGVRTFPSYGAVLTDHVGSVSFPLKVTSTNLTVMNNVGIGVLHDGPSVDAHHTSLIGESNGTAAIWAQGGMKPFKLDTPKIDKSAFAGLVAVNMQQIAINGGFFHGTKKGALPVGNGFIVTLGDGIHIVNSTNIDVENVDLMGNERIGMLLDLGTTDPATAGLKWVNLTVEAPAGAFGALCQGFYMGFEQVWTVNDPVMPWDVGILRDASTLATDQKTPSPLEIVGVIGPDIIPAPTTVITGGLSGIIGR